MPKKETEHKSIYFAGGCFWGTEHFFKQIYGLVGTDVGYANSNVPNPTYRQVSSLLTGAAEKVKVDYDPKEISLEKLIELYFKTIAPSSLNKQGNDKSTRYRTGIYYTDKADGNIVRKELKLISLHHVNIQMMYRKILEESLIISQVHADLIRFETAQNRYKRMCKLSPQVILRAPLTYIANYLQMTPETLSRVRASTLLD